MTTSYYLYICLLISPLKRADTVRKAASCTALQHNYRRDFVVGMLANLSLDGSAGGTTASLSPQETAATGGRSRLEGRVCEGSPVQCSRVR